MKKFLILCLCIATTDSLASGIDANATDASCDNTTLETYSGSANVEINWIPNIIQTRWYNGNTLIDTTNTDATSCVYDDVLNRPTNPTRTGYTFTGWTVRPEIDFAATIPTNENGLERWAIGWYNNANYCWYDTNTHSAQAVNCDSDLTYKELSTYEWKVKFSHGTLYGMARCSATNGTWAQSGNPAVSSGQYCWCRATGYKSTGSDVISGSLFSLLWVFGDNGSVVNCARGCAITCAYGAKESSDFRTSLFTPASN